MLAEIQELVLVYRAAQLKAWIDGDKSLTPSFAEVPRIIRNQPTYHFAETFTLRHYHREDHWLGFAHYAIGDQYPSSLRRLAGREKLREVVPAKVLRRFLRLRAAIPDGRYGRGEPDLFLYKSDGSFRFVEVKKGADRLRPAQLTCIAQLLKVAPGAVDIVYLREFSQSYSPKTYRFDLHRCRGERVA